MSSAIGPMDLTRASMVCSGMSAAPWASCASITRSPTAVLQHMRTTPAFFSAAVSGVIGMARPVHLARKDPSLALAAAADAAAVVERKSRAERRLEQTVIAVDEEIAAAGLDLNVRGHDSQKAFLCQHRLCIFALRVGRETARQPPEQFAPPAGCRRAGLPQFRLEPLDDRPVVSEFRLDLRPLPAQFGQARDEHLRTRQQPLAQPLGEGRVLDRVHRSRTALSSSLASGYARSRSAADTMPSNATSSPLLILLCSAPRLTPTSRAARDNVRSRGIHPPN